MIGTEPEPFLAFDLEVASAPSDFANWEAHRPLGICCAATVDEQGIVQLWYGRNGDGTAADRMSRAEAATLLRFLTAEHSRGRRLVTWNGATFDLNVLAEESGQHDITADLARDHVDLMVVFGAVRGHPLGLGRAARAVGSHKGAEGIQSGAEPPVLWARREYWRVLAYVVQDARATADILRGVLHRRGFRWQTADGSEARFELPSWVTTLQDMTVVKALAWPLPRYAWTGPQFDRSVPLAWTRRPQGLT